MSDDRVDTSRPEYSWIPFFEELARRLHEKGWRHRQPEIVRELQRMRREGMVVSDWVNNLTDWIDPFSLIGTARRQIKSTNTLKILASFKEFFGVDAPLPREDPISPVLNNQSSFLFNNIGEDGQTETHWDLLECVISDDYANDDSKLVELLNRSFEVLDGRSARLTGALFWVKPHEFLKTDTIDRHLNTRNYSDFARTYLDNLARVRQVDPRPFPVLNAEEYLTRDVGEANNVWSMNAGKRNFARSWWLEGGYAAVDWGVRVDLGLCASEHEVRAAVSSVTKDDDALKQIVDFRLTMHRGDVVLVRSEEPGWHHFGISCSDLTYLGEPVDGGDPHLIRNGVMWHPKLIKTDDLNLPVLKALQRVVANKEKVLRRIGDVIHGTSSGDSVQVVSPDRTYTIDTMIDEGVFMERAEIERILEQLRRKQNLILQGPPGTGKTFLAKRLAYALMGERADDCVASVQFHQSYSYEDFVGGYRPGVNDDDQLVFRARDGAFLRLCEKARQAPDQRFVMLIDEINRGNLSRVFGELLVLIEADKRTPESAVELQHLMTDVDSGDAKFYVLDNVYIIGTMNLADRSLTGMNVAMRRRFGFAELRPQFDSERFKVEVGKTGMPDEMLGRIKDRMRALNVVIADDASLGRQYAVGHSFFCPDSQMSADADWEAWYEAVVEFEIRPLLEEYWFDDATKAADEVGKLKRDGSG